jgi:two-component system, chemotaxis family, response regulator WspR
MAPLVVMPTVGNVIIWKNPHRQDSHHQDGLVSALRQHGYCVTTFAQEGEVLQAVLDAIPDLMVIYLQTSGEQGYECCKHLRQMPCMGTIPIVFVGIRDFVSEMASALRCGGSAYFQLPLSAEDCWLMLEHHLKTAQLVRSLEAERENLHQKIGSYNHILQQQEAAQLSLAKENQVLQRLAFTDGLTQIANRSSFNQSILQLWQEAKANQQPISLLLCDVDYFKRYNDTYGHLAGDDCLRAVADALVKGAHRHRDQVARYGGEEFAILLPATDSVGAQQVAIAIRSELAQLQMPHVSSLVKPYVSLSIGICTLSPSLGPASGIDSLQLSHEVLIHGADEAMYTAKLRGRDRIVINAPEGLVSVLGGPSDPSEPPNALSQLRESAPQQSLWGQSHKSRFDTTATLCAQVDTRQAGQQLLDRSA